MAARRAPARMATQGRSPPNSAAEVYQQHHAAQAAQAAAAAQQSSQQDALSVLLVTAGYDHTIRFWEAWSGICSRTIQHPDSQVNRLSISPDKRFLAAAANTRIRLYDCSIASPSSIAAANAAAGGGSGAGGSGSNNIGAPAQPIATLEGHTGNVTGIAWHCDMQWLVSGGEDGLLKIWDLRTSRATRIYDHRGPVNDVVVHPNQGELVSCDQNGSVKVWDLGQNGCSHELVPEEGVPIRSVTVAADGSCLVAGNNTGEVYVWRFINGVYDAQQQQQQAQQPPSPAAAAGGDFTELQPVTTFQAHEKYLTRVLLSPDVRHLATCSADATVKIWSTSRYEFALEKTLVGHQRWVWDAAFSADSAYLVTASSDHVARLWELASGETVRQYNGHHRAAVCVALNDASLGGP
ncbi:related to LST8-required for transport of permeases from the golgi to the plasma membrane [Sporisorium reilianum SRZ2]|uniref:Related to LST8-required for transport of permeases from the golgi to the plasma membrane n=1 Tax=Sporisorium reilianum (strain SRZ2) TaxID=999809 RepID=E7A1T8_SPORE|nr:related to LST8-required for transport of permeases from the golgi to the plasma membrane [Sporisorium reilianum SRZ2]